MIRGGQVHRTGGRDIRAARDRRLHRVGDDVAEPRRVYGNAAGPGDPHGDRDDAGLGQGLQFHVAAGRVHRGMGDVRFDRVGDHVPHKRGIDRHRAGCGHADHQ